MKAAIAFIVGLVLGAIGGAGYFYPQIQSAMSKVSLSETSMQSLKDEAAKVKGSLETAAKEAKDKLAQYQTAKQTDDQTIKSLNDKLAQYQTTKQADDQTIKSLKDQLAAAVAAKEAAEKALEDSKKPPQ